MTRADSTLLAEIAARTLEVSAFTNCAPLPEILPKTETAINATMIQNSGPRIILRNLGLGTFILILTGECGALFLGGDFFFGAAIMRTYVSLEHQ